MEKKLIALILLGTVLGSSVFGQATSGNSASQSSSQSSEIKPSATPVATPTVEKETLEIALLREQIKTTKEYQDALLNTVYFAIGGVFTIALFLAGFNWVTNFKLFEADKKRLVEDFDGRLLKFKSEIDALLSANRVEVFRAMDERIGVLSIRNTADLADLKVDIRRDVERNISDIEKLGDKTEKLAVDSVELQAYLNKRHSLFEAELRNVEAHVWELKKIPGNVLITHSQALRAAVEMGYEPRVVSTLKDMRKCISKDILPSNDRLSLEVREGIKGDVESAAKVAPELVREVLALLQQIQVRQSENPT